MFFECRGNTIVHNEIIKIMEVFFLHGDEKTLTNLFFKLSILPCFYSVLIEVSQNFMVDKRNNAEEYFLSLRSFFRILEQLSKREDCPTLADHISSMQSFKEAKTQINTPVLSRIQVDSEPIVQEKERPYRRKPKNIVKTANFSLTSINGNLNQQGTPHGKPRELSITSSQSRELKQSVPVSPKSENKSKIVSKTESDINTQSRIKSKTISSSAQIKSKNERSNGLD